MDVSDRETAQKNQELSIPKKKAFRRPSGIWVGIMAIAVTALLVRLTTFL